MSQCQVNGTDGGGWQCTLRAGHEGPHFAASPDAGGLRGTVRVVPQDEWESCWKACRTCGAYTASSYMNAGMVICGVCGTYADAPPPAESKPETLRDTATRCTAIHPRWGMQKIDRTRAGDPLVGPPLKLSETIDAAITLLSEVTERAPSLEWIRRARDVLALLMRARGGSGR